MKVLVPFECKKLLKKKSTVGVLLVCLLALTGLFYISFFNDGQISGTSSDPIHGREAVQIKKSIAEKHTDYFSDNLIKQIVNDYAQERPEFKKKSLYDVFSQMVIQQFVVNSTTMLTQMNSSDKVLHFEDIKVRSREQLGSALPLKQLKLGNFAPWNKLFEVINSSFTLIIILTIFICAPVFSGEASKKMNSLILTTKYGRTKLTVAKLLTIFIIGTIIFSCVYMTILIVFANYFGWSGWDTSVQLNLYWIGTIWNIMEFPFKMNLMELLIRLVIFQYVGFLFILSLTSFISSLTKSPLTTFAVSAGVFFAPDFLMNIFRDGIVNKILTILSISTTETEGLLLKLSNNGFLFSDFDTNGIAIILTRIVLSILVCFVTYLIVKRERI